MDTRERKSLVQKFPTNKLYYTKNVNNDTVDRVSPNLCAYRNVGEVYALHDQLPSPLSLCPRAIVCN